MEDNKCLKKDCVHLHPTEIEVLKKDSLLYRCQECDGFDFVCESYESQSNDSLENIMKTKHDTANFKDFELIPTLLWAIDRKKLNPYNVAYSYGVDQLLKTNAECYWILEECEKKLRRYRK